MMLVDDYVERERQGEREARLRFMVMVREVMRDGETARLRAAASGAYLSKEGAIGDLLTAAAGSLYRDRLFELEWDWCNAATR